MNEEKQTVRDFKETFGSDEGKRVLDRLSLFCLANVNQSMFDATSSEQTAYNLGAHSVFRYIQSVLNRKTEDDAEDCQTEKCETEREL